jgi:predicted enzyme related to lactoylglutathione lyase
MADPFEALRPPSHPVEPDPAFAARLRQRLSRALVLPKGIAVSDLTIDRPATAPSAPAPAPIRGRAAITVYLAVSGAPEAIAWYGDALGARLAADPIVMPDGRVGHAELDLAGARIMLSEEHPEIGVVAPEPGAGATFTIHLSVEDVDGVVARAAASGASVERAAADYEYGRNAVLRDPFGHRWMVASEPQPPSAGVGGAGIRHGDIGYVSLWVPDAARAAVFYGRVLGWRFEADDRPQARRVSAHRLHHGIWGGVDEPTLFCCYAVDDPATAADRIRAGGGTASDPHDEPYGRVVEATDPTGLPFAVFTPPGGVAGSGSPTAPGTDTEPGQGDVAYITVETPDSLVTREFYGSVLGWRTSPGRVTDGWNVEDVEPMVGIAGGQPTPRCIPMYRVDDIEAAVARVRDAGGTATDPVVQHYGITSDVTDDQGTRSYLGQLT